MMAGLETVTEVITISAQESSTGNTPTYRLTNVTDITAHSATLNGQVNPNGLKTSYLFQYATNIGFPERSTISTPVAVIEGGTSNVTVSASITNLSENTHYYYRILAYNNNGTSTTDSYSTFDTPFDIRLDASMVIPVSMSVGQSHNISIRILNNSLEQFQGCFYLKDGNTNVLTWSNVTINHLESNCIISYIFCITIFFFENFIYSG
jgi:hypothetical protein